MKLVSSILFALLFITTASFAQPISKYSFDKGVKGIAFDKIELVRYFAQPDGGIRVFLHMTRTGAIQKKNGSLMSGGKEQVTLEALGIVDFSKDLTVVKEEVTFFTPKGAISKQYNILAENDPLRAATIATQDDCADKWDLIDKYPELRQEEDIKEVARPQMYYENSVSYSMLGLKPKTFDKVTHTLKTEKSQEQKDFLSKALSTPGNYDKTSQSVDIEPYRNADKKNYWLKASEPVCDPMTGVVYAHNGHMMRGQMNNRSTEFVQEFVAFDKEGTETARTEIKLEKPHSLNLRELLFTETPENSLYKVDGIVHVYSQNYGFGYKKINPTPDKKGYKYYQWDADGELVTQVDFEVPTEKVNVIRAFHAGDKVSLLATSYKPSSLYTFCFENGQLTCSESLDDSHPLTKGLGFTAAELSSFKWKYNYSYNQKDGSKYYIYALNQEVSVSTQPGTRPTTTVTPKGFVVLRVDQNGKLTHTQHVMRPQNADAGYKSSFTSYPTDNDNYLTVVKDPLVGDASAINVYQISGATLEMTKLAELSGAQELDFKQLPKDNSMLFFSKNAEDQLYQMMLIRN